jgi:hypothetical protein
MVPMVPIVAKLSPAKAPTKSKFLIVIAVS